MNRIDRAIQRTLLTWSTGTARRPERERSEVAEPAEGQPLERTRLLIGYCLAVVLPLVTAAATIPLRASHAGAAALIIVLPVVVVAAIGTTGPAVVAAISAVLMFDLFDTEPYFRFAISSSEDIAAAITLAIVGLVVGVLSSRLAHLAAQNTTRRNELRHLVNFIRTADMASSVDDLSIEACDYVSQLLGLQSCEWLPGLQDGGGPELLPTGAVMGRVSLLNPDRAVLPRHLELAVDAHRRRLGHLVLVSRPDHRSSLEERLTAATVATVFAGAVERIRANTAKQ